MTHADWDEHKRVYGVKETIRLAEFEHGHLRAIMQAPDEGGIDCDLTRTQGAYA